MALGKKYGGRKAGTENVLSSTLRTILKDLLANEIEQIPELLSKLDPKEKLNVLCKLMPFVIPQRSNIEHEIIPDHEPRINLIVDGKTFNLKDKSKKNS